jgi:hypothetical protein
MTAQEQQMLQGLADRINQTQLADKDMDAEQLIQQTLGRNPDALYVMAQTILVQQYALDQAQKQLADARAQLDQARQQAAEPKHASSFLGNLLGRHDEPVRPVPPPPPPVQPQYAPVAGYPLAYAPPGYAMAPPQGGGFLQSAMQTAAGVAAGALAFEGIESLMHGFGHAAGYGTEFAGPGYESASGRPEEIVNNYYGDAASHEHGGDLASDRRDDHAAHDNGSQFDNARDESGAGTLHDPSYVTTKPDNSGTGADDVSGTTDSDYSATGDDSMLADDTGGDQGSDGGYDSGGDDSGGDFGGGDDGGGQF